VTPLDAVQIAAYFDWLAGVIIAHNGRDHGEHEAAEFTRAGRAKPVAGTGMPAEIFQITLGDVSGRAPGRLRFAGAESI
jgi:hypothetical protein